MKSTHKLGRRLVLGGAAGAGGIAAAAALLPSVAASVDDATKTVASKAEPATSGGYRLSEHVKRYYKTARV